MAGLSRVYAYFTSYFSAVGASQAQNVSGPRFVMHDGPPYANGHLHIGMTYHNFPAPHRSCHVFQVML